jgi:hypothetical protein
MAKAARDLSEIVFRGVVATLGRHELGAPERAWRLFRRLVMRALARRLLAQCELAVPAGASLFELEPVELRLEEDVSRELEPMLNAWGELDALPRPGAAEQLGARFEALLGYEILRNSGGYALRWARARKRTGSFYTPSSLCAAVVAEALERAATLGRLEEPDFSACDPACGAGAFLLEIARSLEQRRAEAAARAGNPFDRKRERRRILRESLYGTDVDPVALDVAQIALALYAADPELGAPDLGRLRLGDALLGPGFSESDSGGSPGSVDFAGAFPELRARGFDLVVGNPPWIAFAGRAAQPLGPAKRERLRGRFAAFRGYPTLHGAFVERASRLAPGGMVALLVPSPLADLDGYRPLRRALAESHVVCEPMLEFGQDAFREVTQPCFALVARPLAPGEAPIEPRDRGYRLLERKKNGGVARVLEEPSVLLRLASGEPFPRELFGEMGFQTTRTVSQRLLRRSESPDSDHTYPLLEGRVVKEFAVGSPRLFLRPDAEVLKRERCRLRPADDYRRACFVVRQTAKMPIAALHSGLPFRNTLLAGFFSEALPPDFLVGLLNSTLYRALHVARHRDARQAAFPQVKIAHLRALPRPPLSCPQDRVRELVQRATAEGPTRELRRRLDEEVFDLFRLSPAERDTIQGFARERLPELSLLEAPAGV